MKRHLLTVTRNEADRYLEEMLAWHRDMFDTVTVYDDRSTDETTSIAARYADLVFHNDSTPFLEDESKFREHAWCEWIENMDIEPADHLYVLDADEFLTGIPATGRVRCLELWSPTEARVDGYWGSIDCLVYVPYDPEKSNRFRPIKMGCGRFPAEYVRTLPPLDEQQKVHHFGYVREADRIVKYNRYRNREGHNRSHIESILKEPELVCVTS